MTAVSVIIPTFNRAHMLMQALQSVARQTCADWELIVVDDGSTDTTASLVRSLNMPLRLLQHRERRGVSAARNTGIRNATAPLLAFLDSDDRWLPGKLAAQIAFFRRFPRTLICQTEEIWIRRGVRVNPRKRHEKLAGDIFERSLDLCLISPSAVMLRRELLDEVGLFDEALPVCEDYDLWLRVACRHPVSLIRHALVVKEGGHPDQLSRQYPGMDRYRIQALVKLLHEGELSPEQRRAVFRVLSEKCRIYGNGCLKRGRFAEGRRYLDLPEYLRQRHGAAASDNRQGCC